MIGQFKIPRPGGQPDTVVVLDDALEWQCGDAVVLAILRARFPQPLYDTGSPGAERLAAAARWFGGVDVWRRALPAKPEGPQRGGVVH